ncbi:MAG: hypothetical protein QM785_18630 [Pyrinomonadaceae bacterium]
MITNKKIKLLSAAILVLAASLSFYGQKPTRIQFKKGTSSASVSGSLKAGGSREYVMKVREDQEIHAVVSGKGVALDNGMLTMVYSAPAGDNFIKVMNKSRKPTTYTMTVSIL